MAKSKVNKPAWLIVIITLAYFLIGLTGILNHEVWLDEAHHFLLAKDSTSLADLANNAKYEGHPLLWSVLLFLITRFTGDIFYMQLLNVIVMTAVCFLFLKHSRLSFWLNILILCGYFFIYEYLVISRSYSLLLLALTFTFISLQNLKTTTSLILSLAFLSSTHLFGIIISLVISCLLLIPRFRTPPVNSSLLYLLIFVNLFFLWWINIPSDHFLFHYDPSYFSYTRMSKTAGLFTKGILPLPDFTEPIKWNSNIFISKAGAASAMAGTAIYATLLYKFRKQSFNLWLALLSTALICGCIYLSPVIVSVRYSGIFFILCLYLIAFLTPAESLMSFKPILAPLFILQAAAGLLFYFADLNQEFSNAKQVAQFIKHHHLSDKPIVVSNFSTGPAISCYLQKEIYYVEMHSKGSYCKWNTWPFILSNNRLTEEVSRMIPVGDTLVLVANHHYYHEDLKDTLIFRDKKIKYSLVKNFDNAITNNENYFLFYVYF